MFVFYHQQEPPHMIQLRAAGLAPLVLVLGAGLVEAFLPSSSILSTSAVRHPTSRASWTDAGSTRYSVPGGLAEAVEEGEEYEGLLERSLEEQMRSVAMQWGTGTEPEAELKDTVKAKEPQAAATGRFSEWESLVCMPAYHKVYYGGEHDRFFWRQSRETVYLYVPVTVEAKKDEVHFNMVSKTHMVLAVGDDVILDRELAYPVFKGNSFWYFERPDATHKMVVVELDKRLAYANWPKIFPEDPDLAVLQQQEEGAQQLHLTEEQRQQAMAAITGLEGR